MQQNKFSLHQFYKISIFIASMIFFLGSAYKALAQKEYKYASKQYKGKATTGIIVGGLLIVGGTIGTMAHESPGATGFSSSIYGQLVDPLASTESDATKQVSINLWRAVIAGGTVVSIIGLDHLIKSKRVAPMVAIQKIPGLEHMGIKYGKLPSLGIKYSF